MSLTTETKIVILMINILMENHKILFKKNIVMINILMENHKILLKKIL